MTSVKIRSAIPGRVRWEIAALLDRPDMATAIERKLRTRQGIRFVSANHITGRVLVICQPDINAESLTPFLSTATEYTSSPFAAAQLNPSTERPFVFALLTINKKQRNLALATLVVAFLHRLIEGIRPLMAAFVLKVVIRRPNSKGRHQKNPPPFALLGCLGLAIWGIDALAAYWHNVTSAALANNTEHELRVMLYGHLQRIDWPSIENRAISEWMTVFQDDVQRISKFIREDLDSTFSILTSGLIAVITFSFLARKLAVIQLLTIPAVYVVSTKFLKLIRYRQQIVRQHQGQLSRLLHGNISGMATIISFSNQETAAQAVKTASRNLMDRTRYASGLSAAYIPTIQMCVGIGFVATLVWGGALVKRRQLTSSAFNALSYSSLRFLAAVGRLGLYLDSYERTKLSIQRISTFLQQQPTITTAGRLLRPANTKGDIVFHDVVFGYDNNRQLFPGLNMRFSSGKTTGIVGSSGAGKSSIFKLLLRFYDVNGGSIQLDGIDIRNFKIDDLRRAVAVVPQQTFLFPGTIRENIAYALPGASLKEVQWASEAAEAHDFIESLPQGYETCIGEGGLKLSGGQQQRLVIARSILANRPILLFDEATSAIDPETEGAIHRSLLRIMPGRTMILIAHRLATIRHADLIYVLDHGTVCEAGRHEELLQHNGIYANLWRVQVGEN